MLESISIENPIRSKSTSNKPAGRIDPTRGLLILVARLTGRDHKRIFSLCHYFAIMKPVAENESRHLGQNEMAGLKGKADLQATERLQARAKRREESVTTEHEEQILEEQYAPLECDMTGFYCIVGFSSF